MSEALYPVSVEVNGTPYEGQCEPRKLLVDFLREDLGLTGTHVGCEHGICGACSIMLDGEPVRACLMFAVQADGHRVTTVEGLANADGTLSVLQDSFCQMHGLQCGYCTPGMIVRAHRLLQENPNPTDDEIRFGIAGNLCRCTGYQNIVKAIQHAAAKLRGEEYREAAE